MTEDIQAQLANRLAQLRARTQESMGFGYPSIASNQEMDMLAESVAAYAKPPEGYRHTKKAEKFDSKATLLGLCARLEELCPYHLMPNSWLGDVVPSKPRGETSIRDNIARLKKARRELSDYPKFDQTRKDLKDALRSDSEGYVEAMRTEMARLREEMQPTHARTLFLSDHEIEPVVQFAKAFVTAANEDRAKGNLRHLPQIDRVAKQTACYLSMLDYVNAVEKVVPDMRKDPNALWNYRTYDSQLSAASALFRSSDFKQAPTTARAVQEFNTQDSIIRNAHTAKEVKVASEHLKHLALDFIAGGVAMEEIERRDKAKAATKKGKAPNLDDAEDLPARKKDPKLFSRIEDAYTKDVAPIIAATRKVDIDTSLSPINYAHLPTKTNDMVFAARWAIQAQKLREIVSSKHAMLADPTIDTFHEASTYVGEIRAKGRLRPSRASGADVTENTTFVGRDAAPSSPTRGRSQ